MIIAIQTGIRQYLSVVLIGISLMISDIEHLFKCWLSVYVSGRMSIQEVMHVFKLFVFCWCVNRTCLYILDVNTFSDAWLQLCSPIYYVTFSFVSGFLCAVQKLQVVWCSVTCLFSLCCFWFASQIQKSQPTPVSGSFTPLFSSKFCFRSYA